MLKGIGAVMLLTSARIIVARDGAERRPRSGIQSFPIGDLRYIRLELGTGASGRIAIWTAGDQEVVSMFIDTRSLDRAHELIGAARPIIARVRRLADQDARSERRASS